MNTSSPPLHGLGKGSVEVAGRGLVDAVMTVHDHLDREYPLPADDLEGVHHVLVDGVALELQGLGVHADRHLVVGLDSAVRCDSREEGLPAPGPSGEVVRLDRGDDDQPVSIDSDLVDLHRGPVLGGPEVHAFGCLGVVDDDPVPELLEVGAEDVAVLFLGGGAMGAGGDEVPGGAEVHPLGEGVEDLGGGRRAGAVVHYEHDVLPAFQEPVYGLGPDRVVQRGIDDLVGVSADDVLRIIGAYVVLLGHFGGLGPVPAVPDLHLDHCNRVLITDSLILYVRTSRARLVLSARGPMEIYPAGGFCRAWKERARRASRSGERACTI
jgi:hypothetical protein